MISGIEWLVVLGIVAVLIFWGPKKLPEIARAIGEMKRELGKASKEIEETTKSVSKPDEE